MNLDHHGHHSAREVLRKPPEEPQPWGVHYEHDYELSQRRLRCPARSGARPIHESAAGRSRRQFDCRRGARGLWRLVVTVVGVVEYHSPEHGRHRRQ
jgi:hypothetical protein